ncbi:MAG: AAA family ATPase [Planctomycetota bacterium]
MSTAATIRTAATRYLGAGLSVLPARLAAKFPTLKTWKDYEQRLPTEDELRGWLKNGTDALCVVCGRISGNLEMVDFDFRAEWFEPWCELVKQQSGELLDKLYFENSQSDGLHAAYRCQVAVSRNEKLASRRIAVPGPGEYVYEGDGKVRPKADGDKKALKAVSEAGQWVVCPCLIETRGERGLFLCAPSQKYTATQGDLAKLPVLTAEEREILLEAARSLNEHLPQPVSVPTRGADKRPGDDFNARGDVRAVLTAHGWRLTRDGDNQHWTRPGKNSGASATLKNGVFYVFTSNAPPFEMNKAYSPFSVYTMLEHNGDFAAAAKALRAQGYGAQPRTRPTSAPGQEPQDAECTPRPVLRNLADVTPQEVRWLWPNRIPLGKLTIISGDPGLGKSYVSLDITARLSTGRGFPDRPDHCQVGNIIILNAEDEAEDTIRPRLDIMKADVRCISVMEAVRIGNKEKHFDLATDLAALEEAIHQTPGVLLVIVDPISAYLGKTDSHKNAEVRSILSPFCKLIARMGVAVIGISHNNKTRETKAVYRTNGSIAFNATARAVWSIHRIETGDLCAGRGGLGTKPDSANRR